MSLQVFIALRAEQDMTLQYRWYLDNADADVAERYLLAVHETIQSIAERPDLGIRRHFAAPRTRPYPQHSGEASF
jgi:plasmid stabilization system protein ParE